MFHFRKFSLEHENSTLKIGTDAVILALLTEIEHESTILDVGCGCGVVAFCLAQKYAEKKVKPTIIGIDIDAGSIAESTFNAANFNLLPEECFIFENTSYQEFAKKREEESLDLIITNPPYFHNSLLPSENLKTKSKHGDGNLTFGDILHCSEKLLKEDGRLSIILPRAESEIFTEMAKGAFFCNRKISIHPTPTKPANRVVMEFSKSKRPLLDSSLTILDESSNYTEEYLNLTASFLLIKKNIAVR